jgi:two-component system sensor histidine kinase TctE
MAQAKKPSERRQVETRPTDPHSLFGEILDWMLAPLLLLWPISIVVTNHVANSIADQPYDQLLGEQVMAIAKQVQVQGTRAKINLPPAARDVLRANEEDTVYFQVTAPRGELLVGDEVIPRIAVGIVDEAQSLRYRDAMISGIEVRVAYLFLPSADPRAPVIVQVAETRHKREQLAGRIISGVLLPQFAIIPLAVILVWLGLTRGLAPVNRLQLHIRKRRPDDLSPIPLRVVPDELRPVIAAFNHMMARLEDNLGAQHRFIAAAAHQLKTPLTGLKTQTELALTENDSAQLHGYLARISASVDRAAHLTRQLLQLARAEASHDKGTPLEPIDLESLALETTTHCIPRALAKDIDLGFEHAGQAATVLGNAFLLREMIDNLVDNAIKYTPRGGSVTVRVRHGNDWVLEVEDSGIGIAAEDRSRIFERFYRVVEAGEEGSGLGLAIVREIADLHQAAIEVLPAPTGRGTLMRIAFPLQRP